MITTRRLFTVLLILYLIIGTTYIANTPLFEMPDESSQLTVVYYIHHHLTLPPYVIPERRASTAQNMGWFLTFHEPPLYYAPPLYYTLAAAVTAWSDMGDMPELMVPNPNWERGWPPTDNDSPTNKTMYAHYASRENWSSSATFRTALVLRLLGLALGAWSLFCVYKIGRLLWPACPWAALSAAALTGFLPQNIVSSVGAGQNALFNALFAGFLWGTLTILHRPPRRRDWSLLGLVVGLSLLTKQSALLMLPLGGLTILFQAWPQQHRRRHILQNGALFGLSALLVAGWWYGYHAVQYNDPLGMAMHYAAQVPLQSFGLEQIWEIVQTFYGGFGWGVLRLPPAVYYLSTTVLGISLLGALYTLRPGGPFWQLPRLTRAGLIVLACAALLNMGSLVPWALRTGAADGRLLMPILPAIAVWLIWGITRGKISQRKNILIGLGILSCAAAALIPWIVLRPAFAAPLVHSLPTNLQPAAEPLEFEQVQLLGYTASENDTLQAGQSLDLAVYWQTPTGTAPRLEFWGQFGPLDATRFVSGNNDWLGTSRFPSDLWQAGDLVRQEHRWLIPAAAPAPALYWMRVGLTAPDGTNTVTDLGPWRLLPATPPPAPAVPTAVAFGTIQLEGYTWACRDTTPELTLYWKAATPPAIDYTVFIHGIDATGQMLSQWDGPPGNGNYPSHWWLAGQTVPDSHLLTPLPAAGVEQLQLGLYDPQTGARLPATNNGVALPDAAARIPLPAAPCGK